MKSPSSWSGPMTVERVQNLFHLLVQDTWAMQDADAVASRFHRHEGMLIPLNVYDRPRYVADSVVDVCVYVCSSLNVCACCVLLYGRRRSLTFYQMLIGFHLYFLFDSDCCFGAFRSPRSKSGLGTTISLITLMNFCTTIDRSFHRYKGQE
jgi:hypothetical protein